MRVNARRACHRSIGRGDCLLMVIGGQGTVGLVPLTPLSSSTPAVRALGPAPHNEEVPVTERDADPYYVRPALHVKHVLGYRAIDRQQVAAACSEVLGHPVERHESGEHNAHNGHGHVECGRSHIDCGAQASRPPTEGHTRNGYHSKHESHIGR